MAADVSTMNGAAVIKDSGKSTTPITRDFLGAGCCTHDSEDGLDLDLEVPCGWEKRLDLKSGKVYLQQWRNSTNSASEKLQDLNFPPTTSYKQQTLNLFDDGSLDLTPISVSSSNYQSVCTLDKVKSALERAEKETARKRSVSKSFSSHSSSSIRDVSGEEEEKSQSSSAVAAGCPGCLLYVLISKNNPRCPRCNCQVPFPVAVKRPRVDLNAPF